MTLSSDAATDALWPPGAPVNSNCWNGYSPSSSLSSQPCSPGSTGGLVGHTEKNIRELASMPFGAQESLLQNKRIRLNAETSARACMQVYSHIEGAATSAQLACSVTPSPHTCGIDSLKPTSGGFPDFCSQLPSVYSGGCAASSVDHATKRAACGSMPEVFKTVLASFNPPGMLLGSSTSAAVVEQPTSMPSWPPHQPQFQRLQSFQQQLAQLVTEQPTPACSTTISSLALTLALCDVHAANRQLATTGLPPLGAFQACAAAGAGCAPALGGFPLPFVFTGAVPVAVNVPAPPAPAPAVHSHLQPLPCSVPAVLLDSGMLMNTVARASAVSMAGLPSVFDALSAAAAAAAAVSQLSHLRPPQPPVMVAAAVSQLKTPCLGFLSEPARCTALCVDPRVPNQPPQQLEMRQSLPQRVRPPSPLPPSMPLTPPQPGCLGAEEWILHVVKVLGMSEPDTARLALHCWRRVSELPQLHHAARLWSTTVVGRNLYATACLWVSIKLEEKRRAAPGGVVLAHLAATTPATLCSAELAVMNWLEWRPYDGYRLDESHLLVYM